MPKIKLTKDNINKLSSSGKKYEFYEDTQTEGLAVRVYDSGKKVYFIKKQVHGKRILKAISDTSLLSLSAARAHVEDLLVKYYVGIDPFAEEKQKKELVGINSILLSELYEKWREESILRKEYRKSMSDCYASYGSLKNMRIQNITTKTLRDWELEKIQRGCKNSSINRVKTELRRLLRWGKHNGCITEDYEIPKNTRLSEVDCEPKRSSFSPDEVNKLLAEAENYANTHNAQWLKHIILFLLNTGFRPASACGLVWSDIDMENSTCLLRAANIKTKKSSFVTLSDRAMEILKGLTRLPDSDRVFTKNTPSHVCRCIKRVMVAAGLTQHSAYSLRHNYACTLYKQGCAAPEIQLQMCHSDFRTTKKYIHIDFHHQKTVANKVTF